MSWKHLRYGDEIVDYIPSAGAVGNRDIFDIGGGEAIFVEYVTVATEEAFYDRAVEADARVLAVRRNRQGKKEITWKETGTSVEQEEFGKGWHGDGPRTALW